MKAAVFNLGKGEKRFFLAMHHLIVDGVSWRYLMIEDLSTLYSSSLQQPLPPKTDSYKRWVNTLQNLAPLGKEQIGEWLNIDPFSFPRLSKFPFPEIVDTTETFIYLSKEETLTLISNTRSFYEANPNEILLSALILSISESFGIEKLLIHHEGHGRNPIDSEVDVSRTVGWFTTIYPLLLEKQKDAISTLLKVRENLRRFSRKDLFYCVAKYMQKEAHLAGFCPEILFNYFGRVDEDLLLQEGQQIFGNSQEIIGPTSHSANRLAHLIEINSIILENRLRISVVHDSSLFNYNMFQLWIDSFKKHIFGYISKKRKIACLSDPHIK